MRLFVAIAALALALVLAVPLGQAISEHTRHTAELNQIEETQRAYQVELERQRAEATQAGVIASDYAWRILAIVAAAGCVLVLADAYRRGQRRRDLDRLLVWPSQAGLLPVARAELLGGYQELPGGVLEAPRGGYSDRGLELAAAALSAHHEAQIEAARRALPSHSYAPHITLHGGQLDQAGAQLGQAGAALASVPTFAQLLDRGRVGRGNPLILGFDTSDGAELAGSWLDLYSTAIGGMPGTGKTTSQRFLACQTALHGARFAIIDPHAGAADDSLAGTLAPLASAFACEPASDDKQILEVVRYVADVGKRRIAGKDSDTTPLILWADELTALLGRSAIGDELAELLERVAQEYRKRFVFVCGSGQIWTAARTSSELRDSFASVLCHRMKRSQARLLLPTEEAQQVERLATGTAVLWRTSGATQTIAVPNTTAGDVRRVAELLTDNQPTMPRVSARNQPESRQAVAPDYAAPASAETARIVALFLDGADAGQIVQQVYGLTSRGGQPYMKRLGEVQAAIRTELRQRQAA